MRLIIFTEHYPFYGEPFLEDEIRYAWNLFSSILIVSMDKRNNEPTNFIPLNSRILQVRKSMNLLNRACYFLQIIFAKPFWNELRQARSMLHCGFFSIVKILLLHESAIRYLKKSEHEWLGFDTKEPTIYYSYWLDESATYLARMPKRKNTIYVSRAHGGDCFFNRGYHPYRKEQIENLDCIFPISDAGRQDIISHNSCEQENIVTSRLGIKFSEEIIVSHARKFEFTIVSCSNVISLKRLDLIINALAVIQNIRIQWIHFGDGILMTEIQNLANQKLAFKNNISYSFKGSVDHNVILRYYQEHSVDLFLNVSNYEGISVAAMEAMMFGIPVISRSVGGMAELVDNSCGMILPEKIEPSHLVDAIEHVFKLHEEDYMRLRKNAREIIRNKFSANQNYHDFYSLIFERLKACGRE